MGFLQWLFGKKKERGLPEWVKDAESYKRWKLIHEQKFKKEHQVEEPKIQIQVIFNTPGLTSSDIPDTGSVIPSNDNGWILNPGSTFPLTIYGIDRKTAEELKQILDRGYFESSYRVVQDIMPLVARYNIRCKQINDHIKEFKPLYLSKIEELKKSSTEWATASELDKEDLLMEFKEETITSLDVRPDCDLEILFEGEALDPTIDDALIGKFGYDIIRFYLIQRVGIHVIPADHPGRKMFEQLVEVGLAVRGEDIPYDLILERLKLKELSQLVSDLNPPKFSRKTAAIEFILKVPDLKDRLGKVTSFRTLFQVKPLSEEFAYIDLNQISMAWRYAQEVSTLIERTYVSAGCATSHQREYLEDLKTDPTNIRGWEIITAKDDRCCPFCIKASISEYPKNKYPVVPLHLGCRCIVLPKLNRE